MALRVKRDADNKFYIYIDWNEWITNQAKASPNGPALTVQITEVSWSVPAAITEESETPNDDISGITYFVGSGGSNGTEYPVTATVTYQVNQINNLTDCTQDQSLTLILENQ